MDSDNININLESSNTTIAGDDDVVEVDQEVLDQTSKGKRKRRLTSQVWQFFEMVNEKPVDTKQTIDGKQPTDAKGAEQKKRCKCKKCGTLFLCDSK